MFHSCTSYRVPLATLLQPIIMATTAQLHAVQDNLYVLLVVILVVIAVLGCLSLSCSLKQVRPGWQHDQGVLHHQACKAEPSPLHPLFAGMVHKLACSHGQVPAAYNINDTGGRHQRLTECSASLDRCEAYAAQVFAGDPGVLQLLPLTAWVLPVSNKPCWQLPRAGSTYWLTWQAPIQAPALKLGPKGEAGYVSRVSTPTHQGKHTSSSRQWRDKPWQWHAWMQRCPGRPVSWCCCTAGVLVSASRRSYASCCCCCCCAGTSPTRLTG